MIIPDGNTPWGHMTQVSLNALTVMFRHAFLIAPGRKPLERFLAFVKHETCSKGGLGTYPM